MSKLRQDTHGKPLPPNNKQVIVQVGWLGASGEVYPYGTTHSEIAKTETASYTPLYISIGMYELSEDYQYLIKD